MPRGSSAKREREYENLKKKFQRSGRYKGRADEVAARIVNKQRSQYGETKAARAQEARGNSEDKDLPIRNYRRLTIPQIKSRLKRLSDSDIKKIRTYEKNHKNRKTLLQSLNQQLH